MAKFRVAKRSYSDYGECTTLSDLEMLKRSLEGEKNFSVFSYSLEDGKLFVELDEDGLGRFRHLVAYSWDWLKRAFNGNVVDLSNPTQY